MHYRPPAERPESDRENDLQSAIVEACEDLAAEGPGDILVFLPGERQIHETADALGKQITHSPRLRGTLLNRYRQRSECQERSERSLPHS